MCTLDLRDAYFSIAISDNDKKYLRFRFDKLYEFQVLPFGLNIAPYVFTKVLRPVVQHLRQQGLVSVIYLDDLLLIADTYEACLHNFNTTKTLLESLGFVVNMEKSNYIPSQEKQFLGFVFNSTDLTLNLTHEKRRKIKMELQKFSTLKRCRLRDFAHLIGLLVSVCPAIKYGILYTKVFERTKYLCLKGNDNYDQYLTLPDNLKEDFDWWLCSIETSNNSIRSGHYYLEFFTDASLSGWGASCSGETASGQWNIEEQKEHINYLELTAIFFGLKVFASNVRDCEILLRVDNTTAISYINRMGGIRYPRLNSLSRKIWQWCEVRGIYLFASYIRSKDNVIADAESRRIHADVEWALADYAFNRISTKFLKPDIDLFASRLNNKCYRFVSWHRDPEAFCVDAFTISWSEYYFYAFPPFSLILRVLQKIVNDKAEGIVVVPLWPTQAWFPLFKKLLLSEPLIFPPKDSLLSSPYSVQHKLQQNLTLAAGMLSGRRSC